jgi:hypothetical protein
MSDRNAISFNGPHDNGLTVDLRDTVIDPGDGGASGVKCSTGLRGFVGQFGRVVGRKDAVIDGNNSIDGVRIEIAQADPRGQFVSTIKGGARNVYLRIESILQHAKRADLITDDWSDQSHKPTAGIVYDCRMLDGSAVTVLALKTKPVFARGSGPYRFLFPWPWINPAWLGHPFGFAFDTLRRWGFFRKQAN